MPHSWPLHSKTGLTTSLSGFNPGKLALFVAKLSRDRHDSTNFNDFVNRKAGNSIFLLSWEYLPLQPCMSHGDGA
jgi:hypothetical protein